MTERNKSGRDIAVRWSMGLGLELIFKLKSEGDNSG
jgi:hypothetical protein